MTKTAGLERLLPGHEVLLCKACGRPVRMERGRMLTCKCGEPGPEGCWTTRALADSGDKPPLVYIKLVENARKPCTRRSCQGCMVFHAETHEWECTSCGRKEG